MNQKQPNTTPKGCRLAPSPTPLKPLGEQVHAVVEIGGGPVFVELLGVTRALNSTWLEARCRVTKETRSGYHRDDEFTWPLGDIFARHRYTGIASNWFEGRPDFDALPDLGVYYWTSPTTPGPFSRWRIAFDQLTPARSKPR